MRAQLTLGKSFECQLAALEARVEEKREYHGLKLWTPIFRGILERMLGRDKAVQQELMQLEYEVRSDSVKALARLEKIKLLMGCVCLGLLMVTSLQFGADQLMRVRGARRGREEVMVG